MIPLAQTKGHHQPRARETISLLFEVPLRPSLRHQQPNDMAPTKIYPFSHLCLFSSGNEENESLAVMPAILATNIHHLSHILSNHKS